MSVLRPSVAGRLRFDPQRTWRHHVMTSPRPRAEYVLTCADREDLAEWEGAWMRNEEGRAPANVQAFWAWRSAIYRWCDVRKLRFTMDVQERPATLDTLIRWRVGGQ